MYRKMRKGSAEERKIRKYGRGSERKKIKWKRTED
jgi:hypothetical protein